MDLARFGHRARLDIAPMFSALAAIVLLPEIINVTCQHIPWLGELGAMLLLAQRYLLLRLVQRSRPVARPAQLVALGGMAISCAILILFPAPLPPLSQLIVAYFVYVEGNAAVAFVRGAFRTEEVTGPRLAIATDSGLLAIVILLAGLNHVLPGNTGLTTLLSQLLALLAMLSYYLGFAKPGNSLSCSASACIGREEGR